jgi:acetyl esterase/lipase
VVLHFHPGGFIMGSPIIRDGRNRMVARAVHCMVVSVEYRLAPEAPFPAALDDGYAALRWVRASCAELGGDPARIAVAGESAGGGVAAAVVQLAHDRGDSPVLLQLLTYPMLDDRVGASLSAAPSCGEFVWTRESNQFAWAALLGEHYGERTLPRYAAPGRREELAGLPPTFIAVGAIDLFAEEDIGFARRLLRAGVATELHVFPGAFHGFDSTPGAWSTQAYIELYLAALRRAFAQPSGV